MKTTAASTTSILLAILLMLFFGGIVASATDTDSDGMEDDYETFFLLDPNDSGDAVLNYDDDTLTNLQEAAIWTDPFIGDTDNDGWKDGVDSYPLSRAVIMWGDTNFASGDSQYYTGPTWWLTAQKSDGAWTNESWQVPSSESNSVGSLLVTLDRTSLTSSIIYEAVYFDHSGSGLYMDLLDTNGMTVVTNLSGNLISGTDAVVTQKIAVALDAYTSASGVKLRRTTGDITVYASVLYIDQDGDGLDLEQEWQLGTSDHNPDTTPPEIYCQVDTGSVNVALNSSLEDGGGPGSQTITNWNIFGQVYQEENLPRTGTRHAKMFGNFVSAVNYSGLYQDHSASEGQTWRGSARVLTATNDYLQGQNRAFVKLEYYNSSMGYLGADESTAVNSNMERGVYMTLAITGVTPTNTAYVRQTIIFEQNTDNAGGSVCVDDASLEQVVTGLTFSCQDEIPAPNTNAILAVDDTDPDPTITHVEDIPDAGSGCPGGPQSITRVWRATDDAGNSEDCSVTYTIIDDVEPSISVEEANYDFIANGGFEQGGGAGSQSISNWIGFGAYYHEDKIQRSGQYHVKLFNNFVAYTNFSGVYQDQATISGEIWRATAYALTDYEDQIAGENETLLKLEFCDASYTAITEAESDRLGAGMVANEYVELQVSGVAPASSAYVRVTLLFEGDPYESVGSIYFDDVTLERISMEPPPADANVVSASDNCDGSVIISHVADSTNSGSGCSSSPHVVERIWRATDGCGNYNEATQTFTYADTTAPILLMPEDITIDCLASTNPADTGTATGIGDVDETVTVTYDDQITSNTCPDYSYIDRTWTAEDDCGNTASDVQRITLVCDTDSDGMPDCWESTYGLNPNNASDASADADSDGLNNLEEYQAGSDPTDTDTDDDGVDDDDEVNTYGSSPTSTDSDGDGLDDGWEVANSLNPAVADQLGDDDGDGLNNAEEYEAGTDPQDTDTDDDGVSDEVEVHSAYSNPLAVDFTGAVQDVVEIKGSNGTVIAGTWDTYGDSLYGLSRGGEVSYSISVPSNGYYALEVEATQFDPNIPTNTFAIELELDGTGVGRRYLTAVFGESGTALCFLPPLTSGTHTVSVKWDYRLNDGTLRIIALRLQSFTGTDTNSNGRADWLDARADRIVVTPSQTTSLTSPFFYEGQSPVTAWVSIESSYQTTNVEPPSIARGVQDDWYADVYLSPTNTTEVTIQADNGWLVFSNTVTWSEFNLLALGTNTYSVRAGDSILLTCYPTNETSGTVSLDVVGITNFMTTVDSPVDYLFSSSGVHQIVGSWTNGGSSQSATVDVSVVAADFNGSPIVYLSRLRNWDNPDVPTTVVIESDPHVNLSSSLLPAGTLRLYLSVDTPGTWRIAARLADDGPILDLADIHAIDVYSSNEVILQTVHTYSDGTQITEMVIHVTEVVSDLQIRIEAFTSGVTLIDGSIVVFLTADDFDENGEARVYFITVPGWDQGICHGLRVYQDDDEIGTR